MGVAGPEPAMAGASAGSPIVPRARRAYALTAPPNLNGKKALTLKREAPTIWELQTAMAASEQVEAPTVRKLPVAPRTWGRAHSTAVESAALAESEGNMSVDCDGESRGGGSSSSWPRVRKQRTGVRNSMSLWEVSEALDGNAPQHPAVLPSPDTLDAHTLADLGDDLSFVDNMFFSHAPAPAPVSAPDDSMGMAALGALMIAPAARWRAGVTPPAPFSPEPLPPERRCSPEPTLPPLPGVCRRGRSQPHPLQPQDQRPGSLGAAAPRAVDATPVRGGRASAAAYTRLDADCIRLGCSRPRLAHVLRGEPDVGRAHHAVRRARGQLREGHALKRSEGHALTPRPNAEQRERIATKQ